MMTRLLFLIVVATAIYFMAGGCATWKKPLDPKDEFECYTMASKTVRLGPPVTTGVHVNPVVQNGLTNQNIEKLAKLCLRARGY